MQKPDGQQHGELFHYVSTNTDVLGWVYERACDQPYADIVSEYLWQPLGAEHDAYITVDAHNAMRAAGGICVTPRDLARFGEMIRRRGVANGRQVVPGAWIDDINERRRSGGVGASANSPTCFRRPAIAASGTGSTATSGVLVRVRHPRPMDLHPSRGRTGDHPHGVGSNAARSRSRARLAARLRCDRGAVLVNSNASSWRSPGSRGCYRTIFSSSGNGA